MNFNEALELKNKNGHLIGKKDNGATIDELILVPTDSELADIVLKNYLLTLDGNTAVIPNGADLDVVVVFDKKRIRSQNFFLKTSIFNLPAELGVKM